MFQGIGEQLLAQEVVYEQYRGADTQEVVGQSLEATEGAITDVTSNTLVPNRSGAVMNLELPQALASTSDPTFNSISVADDATTRSNLGLGTMAIANEIAAVADLSQTISNPPTKAEVENIQNKINELLAAARAASHLAP